MTAAQVTAILSMVSQGRQGRLNSIKIWYLNLIGTVSPLLFKSARKAGGQLLNLKILNPN